MPRCLSVVCIFVRKNRSSTITNTIGCSIVISLLLTMVRLPYTNETIFLLCRHHPRGLRTSILLYSVVCIPRRCRCAGRKVCIMLLDAPVSSNQRYVRFTDHLRRTFGCRVHKVSLDVGFTCPNRDGTVAVGGCIYCNNASFSPGNRRLSVTEQLEQDKRFLRQRYGAQKFIAYFQAYTNTYDDIQVLQSLYNEALACKDIVGLAIGTRPDCVPEAVLDLLADYAARTYLWLELGLESGYDHTLTLLNRGHTVATFDDAVRRAQQRHLRLCTHVILGLPGESLADMLATGRYLAALRLDAIKLHHLHVVRHTVLEKLYHQGQVPLLSLEEYAPLVVDCLEVLPP